MLRNVPKSFSSVSPRTPVGISPIQIPASNKEKSRPASMPARRVSSTESLDEGYFSSPQSPENRDDIKSFKFFRESSFESRGLFADEDDVGTAPITVDAEPTPAPAHARTNSDASFVKVDKAHSENAAPVIDGMKSTPSSGRRLSLTSFPPLPEGVLHDMQSGFEKVQSDISRFFSKVKEHSAVVSALQSASKFLNENTIHSKAHAVLSNVQETISDMQIKANVIKDSMLLALKNRVKK